MGSKINKKAMTYLGILCLTCPVFYYLSIRSGGLSGGSIFLIALMWMPAFAAVCTKLLYDHSIKGIGWRIKGWRGFLLTELRRTLTYRQLNWVIGIIWYVYHMPLIVFSNYNNGNKLTSAICFFVMVVSMTVIANTLCMKAGSMWPSVVLHASHNLFVQSIFDQMTVDKGYTRYITSEFGVGLALCYAAVAAVVWSRHEKRNISGKMQEMMIH